MSRHVCALPSAVLTRIFRQVQDVKGQAAVVDSSQVSVIVHTSWLDLIPVVGGALLVYAVLNSPRPSKRGAVRFLGSLSLVSGFVLHEQWFHREYPGDFEWSVFMVCVRACDPGGDPDFWANAIIGVGLPALMVALAVMLFANSRRRERQAT